MALPAEQLRDLEECARSFERRIAALRRIVDRAEDEIRVNETLLSLARDDRLLAALERTYDGRSEGAATAASDLQRRCDDAGVQLPDGVTLRPRTKGGPEQGDGEAIVADVQVGDWTLAIRWDPTYGFRLERDSAGATVVVAAAAGSDG